MRLRFKTMWAEGMTLPKFVEEARIAAHESPGAGVYIMTLTSPAVAAEALPGQFVDVSVPLGTSILRRPLGIAEVSRAEGWIRLIYRVVGQGTQALAAARPGARVSVLGPLGKGFRTQLHRPLLVGGGMGLSPLLFFAAESRGTASVLMGGRTKDELFWEHIYAPYVHEVFITTDDGSYGTKGFVTTLLPELLAKESYDGIAVCGPPVMMQRVAALAASYDVPCEVSLERHMACGLGACLSCAVDTKYGRRKVCKDGPVFSADEVYYDAS